MFNFVKNKMYVIHVPESKIEKEQINVTKINLESLIIIIMIVIVIIIMMTKKIVRYFGMM